jgi:cellulose biosynthesis protein BcsQ
MDPQGSASFYFRVRPAGKLKAGSVVRGGSDLDAAVRGSDYPYLDIIPADISYRNIGRSLRQKKHPKRRLSKVFDRFRSEYDFLFVDCPPGISLGAENIFRASDLILMPIIPSTLSMETKDLVYKFFRDKGLDTSLIVPFFSMVDRRKKLHRETVCYAKHSGGNILETYIPVSSSIEKMGISRQPLCAVSQKSPGAEAYARLWMYIKERLWSE